MRRCDPRASTTASTGSAPSAGTSTGAPRSHGEPSASRSPARCAAVTSGNSRGAASTSPVAAGAGRVERGRAVTEGDDGHGQLVHAVRADERGDRRVREAAVEQRGDAPTESADGQHVGKHGPGVPVDVPVSPLAVAPAGAPRDAGDDEGGRIPARRRSDLHERVVLRVVPVHAGGQRAFRRGRRRTPRGGSGRPRTRRRGRTRSRTAAPSSAPPPPTGAATGRGAAGPAPGAATSAVPASTATAGAVVGGRSRGSASRGSDGA